jgi:hypothetical protein
MARRSDENEALLHLCLRLLPRLLVDDLAGVGSAWGHMSSNASINERCSRELTSSFFFRINMVRNLKGRFDGFCTWVCVAKRSHCVQVPMSDVAANTPRLLHLSYSARIYHGTWQNASSELRLPGVGPVQDT